MFKVLHNRLLPYRLLYPALCLDVEWIRLHRSQLALRLDVSRTCLAQELCEPVGIRLRSMGEFRICLCAGEINPGRTGKIL